jgi:microcin C transport system permease protein
MIGVMAGAVRVTWRWVDLIFQRFIEVWGGSPVLYLLIILSSLVEPNFWWLGQCCSSTDVPGRSGPGRILRPNFDYVRAARALGVRTV